MKIISVKPREHNHQYSIKVGYPFQQQMGNKIVLKQKWQCSYFDCKSYRNLSANNNRTTNLI